MDANHTSLVLFGSVEHESAEDNFAHLDRLHRLIIVATTIPDCPVPWDVFQYICELTNYEKLLLMDMMSEWRRKVFIRMFGRCITECLN